MSGGSIREPQQDRFPVGPFAASRGEVLISRERGSSRQAMFTAECLPPASLT
jgi:hypothetical protein